MEPSNAETNVETTVYTQKYQSDDLTAKLDELPVTDKKTTLTTEDGQTKIGEEQNSKALYGEGENESADLRAAKTDLQDNISKGLKRIVSFGVTLDRDVRHEQLTQLIAGKLREGDLLMELNSKNNWEVATETPVWTVHTRKQGANVYIRNEFKLNCSFSTAKALLIEYRKKRQVNIDNNEPSATESVTSLCSINYERSTSSEPTDYLILRLERQTKEGNFKVAEMSIEDRRCPVIPGVKRGHVELRYWQISPVEGEEKSCKLWLIEAVKPKTKGEELDVKYALERNKVIVQKIMKEVKF